VKGGGEKEEKEKLLAFHTCVGEMVYCLDLFLVKGGGLAFPLCEGMYEVFYFLRKKREGRGSSLTRVRKGEGAPQSPLWGGRGGGESFQNFPQKEVGRRPRSGRGGWEKEEIHITGRQNFYLGGGEEGVRDPSARKRGT